MALESFKDRLRFVRLLWGMTQADIQRAGGPSRNTISRWENDLDWPANSTNETLSGLAAALKCNLDWLLDGTGPIWVEGIVPPPGGNEPQIAASSMPSPPRADPELGRYILDGPVDCAVLWRAVEIVHDYTQHDFENFNYPEGIWLAYKFLSKRKDPLGKIEGDALSQILSLV